MLRILRGAVPLKSGHDLTICQVSGYESALLKYILKTPDHYNRILKVVFYTGTEIVDDTLQPKIGVYARW